MLSQLPKFIRPSTDYFYHAQPITTNPFTTEKRKFPRAFNNPLVLSHLSISLSLSPSLSKTINFIISLQPLILTLVYLPGCTTIYLTWKNGRKLWRIQFCCVILLSCNPNRDRLSQIGSRVVPAQRSDNLNDTSNQSDISFVVLYCKRTSAAGVWMVCCVSRANICQFRSVWNMMSKTGC
jgi:hypothetical protein